MPGAFAQNEVLFPRNAVKSTLNSGNQRFVIRGLEILAREIRLDSNGTHIHERTVKPIDAVHQQDVFIDLLLSNFNEALPHRFDVTYSRIVLL